MEVRTRQESRWLALTPGAAGGPERQHLPQNCTVFGDGHLDAGEDCDDGNNVNGGGCNNTSCSRVVTER
jgi:cysteine-rich repeat protein